MKLESKTLQILKNFSTINPSILFKEGTKLQTCTPNRTMFVTADIKEDIPSEFAISELSRLLGVLTLFESPEIEVGEKTLTISSGTETVSYTFADKSVIVYPQKDIKMPDCEVNFTLTNNTLQGVLKAMSLLQLPELAVTGRDGKIYVETINHKKPSSDVYSSIVGETEHTFRSIIRQEHLKFMPENYEVSISKQGIARFKGISATYYVATEASSTFES